MAVRDLIPLADGLLDVDWVVIAIVFEDVRHREWDFVARIDTQLRRARAA